ncbi:hypothetical protein Pcinc_007065 [Petrolisthes cinctipes]|uniref:Uncharacterized protein n=1 Tax=Petrolisthes cinctipes TaxID=88211 RepID=A0AAE1GBW5_PETCI|nr:hypothetical protein Pcinc_007065 [Petrolisthes cinctipes]
MREPVRRDSERPVTSRPTPTPVMMKMQGWRGSVRKKVAQLEAGHHDSVAALLESKETVPQDTMLQDMTGEEQEGKGACGNTTNTESETESVYESRKLLMRRAMQHEARKAAHTEMPSDADSWDDLEDSFARIYEPLPCHSWRGHLLPQQAGGSARQHQVVAQVHAHPRTQPPSDTDTDTEFGETDYVTRSELYRNIRNLQDSLARHNSSQQQSELGMVDEDSQSWQSLPTQNEEPVYISRSEILSRVDPTYASRSEMVRGREDEVTKMGGREAATISRSEILSRLKEMRDSEDERGLSPTHTGDSNWDLCSCVSCEHCGPDHTACEGDCECGAHQLHGKRHKDPARPTSPTECSLLSQDSWSIGEFEKIYEPVGKAAAAQRLQENFLVNQMSVTEPQLEHSPVSKPRYLPLDVWSLSESEDVYESLARVARASVRSSGPSVPSLPQGQQKEGDVWLRQRVRELLRGPGEVSNAARTKVVEALTQHITSNLNLTHCRNEDERNQEIRERLQEALAQDWETLSNINLGQIYVPMEESSTSKTPSPMMTPVATKENTDYDTFGSIDSLIFEPRVPAVGDEGEQSQGDEDEEEATRRSVDRLLDQALLQPYPALTPAQLLHPHLQEEEEKDEEETPAPTPDLSTPTVESEQELTGQHTDEEQQSPKQEECSQQQRDERQSPASPWSLAPSPQTQPVRPVTKMPLKQKIYKSLMGLGFVRFGSRESVKAASSTEDVCKGKVQSDTPIQHSQDHQNINSFRLDLQCLAARRLPSEDDSAYDYHPDHRPHGTTTTSSGSNDTPDSETDSVTSLESVIFRGNSNKETSHINNGSFTRRKIQSSFSHKFVVNRGHESDNSELQENKSVSQGTHPYLDSDTSWDYMEAGGEEEASLQRYQVSTDHTFLPVTPGPHVVANLRRQNLGLGDTPDHHPPATPGDDNPPRDSTKRNSRMRDAELSTPVLSSPTESPSPGPASTPTEENSDGRQLFRAFEEQQIWSESEPGCCNESNSTQDSSTLQATEGSITTHNTQTMYDVCGGGRNEAGNDTPPVVLLKHHVYQSIESLASRMSSAPSIRTVPTEGSMEDGQLQMYGQRHGEPIYGVRNSRLFHSMNGAFVTRECEKDTATTPVVIRRGRAVELTEEMFRCGDQLQPHDQEEHKVEPRERDHTSLTFHTTLLPPPDVQAPLYFHNTVSSTESREVHSYENDSEIYGTRKEIRDEILQASKEQLNEIDKPKIEQSVAKVLPQDGDKMEGKGREQAGTPTDKIKRVQKLGVSILGNNNDMMIRELKLKLRRRFSPHQGNDSQDEDEEEANIHKKQPVISSLSVGSLSSNSVAVRREQLAPHISKILGSLHHRPNIEEVKKAPQDTEEAKCDDPSPGVDSTNHTKEEKQERNEREKEREILRISSDGGVEQVYVPTPDYTPVSTLPRENQQCRDLSPDLPILDELLQSTPEDYSFDLADLAKFVHEHIAKNKNLYTDHENRPGVDPGTVCQDTLANSDNITSPKRSVRFDLSKKLADLNATWSDLESLIFTDEKNDDMNVVAGGEGRLPGSRMDCYRDTEGLLWQQLAKMRRSRAPEDRHRWQLEKTKRMLLWIHLSTDSAYTEWCYSSQWWKAKQRASVAWIVQKAHKNKVPSDLQDPYYRDYEGVEHLKPGIVHRLANADLYCSALANIYGDPNFHNLSHWNIIQALARKGVYVAEPTDVALTETVLIQVTPIKMSAHLAVIEAMMALYIREVVVAERAVAVLQRVGGPQGGVDRTPQDQEEALVLWISHIVQALQERIHLHQEQDLPVFPRIQDLSDLSDGIGLAALVAFYCPQELSWRDIAVADPPSIADSLYNVGLVIKFCQESLPYNPCLLTKEDIVYMHSSVKQNVLAFAAELFFLLELEPVSCVSLPGTKKMSTKYIQLSSPAGRGGGKSTSSGGSTTGSGPGTGTGLRRQQSLTEHERPRKDRVSIHEGMKPAGAPSVRRSHSMNLNDMTELRSRLEQRAERYDNTPSSYNSDCGGRDSSMSDGQEGDFVVQRSRGLSTLSDMMRTQSPRPSHDFDHIPYSSRSATKERFNMDSKEEELGERSRGLGRRGSINNSHPDLPAAGMPSRYEERPHGRSRSRRNSISAEDSQLTIENFGGSQDNLNYIARNPDKEPFVHTGRRESSNLDLTRESREGSARPESRCSRERSVERRLELHRDSMDELDNRLVDKLEREALEREKRDSHHMSKEKLVVRDPRKALGDVADSGSESDASFDRDKQMVKATSFAELSKLKEQLPGGINIIYMQSDKDDSSKRSKGSEKKTTFAALPNQTTWKQQSAQCHSDDNKSASDENMEPQVMASELHNVRLKLEEKRRRIESEKRKMEQAMNKQRQKLGKEAFMQAVVKGDISSDVSNLSRRWLEGSDAPAVEVRTPDLDTMDYEQYHHSLTQMTDSLTEIQGDIHRLNQQQHQIQSLMHNGMNPPPGHHMQQQQQQQPPHGQFYLHDQQGSPVRRMWGQQGGSEGYSSMSPATRRAQWGPARPMMPQGDYMMAGQHPGYYPGYQVNHLPPMNQVNAQPQMPPVGAGGGGGGFMLHSQPQSLPPHAMYQQNGQGFYSPEHQFRGYPSSAQMYGSSEQQRQMGQTPPFRLHGEGGGGEGWSGDSRGPGSLRSSAQSSPSRQPPSRQQKSPSPPRQTSVSHAPVAAPPPDDMEPQSVSFINSTDQQHIDPHKDDDTNDKFKRLSITSGSKTYRISHEPGSPTRPSLGVKTFRVPTKKGMPVVDDIDLPQPTPLQRSRTPPYYHEPYINDDDEDELNVKAEPLQEGPNVDKGFYISFDGETGPRKPKPLLRNKKMSRKNSSPSTPATTPSKEDLPIVPDRPSRTSNDTFDPHRGSMTQFTSPSMVKTPFTLTSQQSSSNSGSSTPKANGLSHNPPCDAEQDEESEPGIEEVTKPHTINRQRSKPSSGTALVITADEDAADNSSASEMEKKKERLMMMSMKRKQEQEEARLRKEMEAQEKREIEKIKEEEKHRKKEEERARRQVILERYKIKKAMEDAEKEGRYYEPPPGMSPDPPSMSHGKPSVRLRNKPPGGGRPRPKTMAGSSTHETDGELTPSRGKKGSSQNIAGEVRSGESRMRKSSGWWGSSHSLSRAQGSRGSNTSLAGDYPSTSRTLERGHTGRRPTSVIGYTSLARPEDKKASLYGSQDTGLNYGGGYRVHEARRPSLATEGGGPRTRRAYTGLGGGHRKYRSTGNISGQSEHDSLVYHMSEDSGLGRATPPRRAPSPGMARHLPSPSGPGSLPPGLFSKRRPGGFDDAASDISTTSSTMDYYGPRLFKQPTAKSNRTIILNAVEYCVFPGMVNQTAKHRVLEEIARSESKHFLILFRDTGCQFRAIYSFNPDSEEVYKLYGTGPKLVNDRMFDKFFKYNSGGKCFSQIHTKHLTVTIDAFTIHNSLWQGKRVNLPSKKDMTLVI